MRVCRHFSIACEIVGREGTWGSGLGRLALQARDQGGGKYHEVSAFASPQQLDNQRHSALGVAKNSSPLLTRRVAPASSRGASGVPEATGTSNHRRNLTREKLLNWKGILCIIHHTVLRFSNGVNLGRVRQYYIFPVLEFIMHHQAWESPCEG